MKTFTISEEQISQLLEMTIKLFPQYKNITFVRDSNVGAYDYTFNNILFSNEEKYTDHLWKAESIHWFEFTYTNLASKIFNHVNYPTSDPFWDDTNGLQDMTFNQLWINNYHPINYLYNEFKKIKL